MNFTTHFNCKQTEKHDFSRYLILDQIQPVKSVKRGVLRNEVLGGLFQQIDKERVHLFAIGLQMCEDYNYILCKVSETQHPTFLNF